jgi:hypothetical protein
MPIDVYGPSGLGPELAPVTPIRDPLSYHPGLKSLEGAVRPTDSYDGYWKGLMSSTTSFQRQQNLMDPMRGPGTLQGGPRLPDYRLLSDPRAFTVAPRQPIISSSQLGLPGMPADGLPGRSTMGVVELNLIDPFEFPNQLTSDTIGRVQPVVGENGVIDPLKFLADRHIDPLANLPTRILDYAVAGPLVLAMKATGNSGKSGVQKDGANLAKYRFQQDGRYWAWVAQVDERGLAALARQATEAYTGGMPNPAIQMALTEQMRRDRDLMQNMSSGEESIDYRAKQYAWAIELARRTGDPGKIIEERSAFERWLPAIPFFGTQAANLVDPVTPEIEAHWQSLDPEERQRALEDSGGAQMLSSTLITLPLMFSGQAMVSVIAARAAQAGGPIGKVVQAYNVGKDVMTQVFRVGVASAVANWTAEAAIPGYSDLIGEEIDTMRPFTESPVAAAINLIGYFASPKEVFGPLYRPPLNAVRGLRGQSEIGIYRAVGGLQTIRNIGRSVVPKRGDAIPIDQHAFEQSFRKLALSEAQGVVTDEHVAWWSSLLRDVENPYWTRADGTVMPIAERPMWATQSMRSLESSRNIATHQLLLVQTLGRANVAPLALHAERVAHDALGVMSRAIDDAMTRRYVAAYDSTRIAHSIGAGRNGIIYGRDTLRTAVVTMLDRMGYQADVTKLTKNVEGLVARTSIRGQYGSEVLGMWEQVWRALHHREFDHLNGVLRAAARGTGEEASVTVVRADHLFGDLADSFLADIDTLTRRVDLAAPPAAAAPAARPMRTRDAQGRFIKAGRPAPPEPAPAPAAPRKTRAEVLATARELVEKTPELQKWWAELNLSRGAKAAKMLDELPLSSLANHIRRIRGGLIERRMRPGNAEPVTAAPLNALNLKLDAEGIWTLAHKPGWNRAHLDVGIGEGTFASYHWLDDLETFFQSPWLDYPMSAPDQVVLGGQGFVGSRIDGITRAFRTWRISEFQKSLTTRIITRYEGASPEQARLFFEQVTDLTKGKPLGVGKITTLAGGQAHAAVERTGRDGARSLGRKADLSGDIQDIGNRVFGKRPFRNLDTGEMEDVDWAWVIQQGFRQSFRLNLTAGVTSRLKAMPLIGDAVILGADIAVPLLRFTSSAVFRVGEYVESKVLNMLRGVDGDPIARSLSARTGLMREYGVASQELAADPMVGTLIGPSGRPANAMANRGRYFSTPLPNGRTTPGEAASVSSSDIASTPGVDLPGGPDAPPPTPAEARYAEARQELAQAELELEQATSTLRGVRDIGEEFIGGQRYRASVSRANEADFQAQLMDESLFLSEGGEQALMERVRSAQNEYEAARAALEPPELTVQRQASERLAETSWGYRESVARMETIQRQELRDLAWSQQQMEALSKDLPVFAPERPGYIRMYHGTGDAFDVFDRGKVAPQSLYGPGFYLTENGGKVPVGYARARQLSPAVAANRGTPSPPGVVLQVDVPDNLRLLDLDAEVPHEMLIAFEMERIGRLDELARLISQHPIDAAAPDLASMLTKAAALGDDEMTRLYQWLDDWAPPGTYSMLIDQLVRADFADVMYRRSVGNATYAGLGGTIGGASDLWRASDTFLPSKLRFHLDDAMMEPKALLNEMVEAEGYDGLTHMGGQLIGNVDHRVRIVFDPKKAEIVAHNLADIVEQGALNATQIDQIAMGMDAARERYAGAAEAVALGRRFERRQAAIQQLSRIDDDVARRAAASDAAIFERRAEQQLAAARALREQKLAASAEALTAQARARGPRPATELSDIPGQPEHLEKVLEEMAREQPKGIREQMLSIIRPGPYKEEATNDAAIAIFRDIFPKALRASKNRAVEVLEELGVPEREWVRFLTVDRSKMQRWVDTGGDPAAFREMEAWSEQYRVRNAVGAPELDAFYGSPEFEAMSSLWAMGVRAAQDEAFGIHYFAPYRSLFGRSINHPLLAVYPAAWAFKVAKEWFRFLYDNSMFGDRLSIGMAPAVIIRQIEEAQNRTFAWASGGQQLSKWLEDGPLGSAIFIFNLLMPGDWSAIPFPLSRSLRMIVRGIGGDPDGFNPVAHVYQNTVGAGPYGIGGGGMGGLRDGRLAVEAWDEMMRLLNVGQDESVSAGELRFRQITNLLANDGVPGRPREMRYITSFPTP